MVVGDDDFRPIQVAQHVGGHQFSARVVAVGIVGLEDAQAVANGDPRRDHEKAAGEARTVRAAHRVHRLPRNEHGHHGGLAGTGGELQGQTREAGVGLFACRLDPIEEASPLVAELRRHFREPDSRLHGLDLAEEGADTAEGMVPPVFQQPSCLRRYAPVRLRQRPPSCELLPQTVDQCSQFVLLVGRCKRFAVGIERELRLRPASGLPWFRYRGNEGHTTPTLADLVGGLPAFVENPVPSGHFIRGVQDRIAVEGRGVHALSLL